MNTIKNIIIKAIVMIVVVVITMFFVNKYENRAYSNLAIEMEDSTLPLIYINYGDQNINVMHGYTCDVDTTLLRDSITPIDENKQIKLVVQDDTGYAKKYSYEVRTLDGSSLVENGDLEYQTDERGFNDIQIDIRMDLKADVEYMLIVKAMADDENYARYYTRIVLGTDYHVDAMLHAARDFNDASFDFTAYEDDSVINTYSAYYKSRNKNKKLDEGSFAHSTLASSYSQLTWYGLDPTKVSTIYPTIKEISNNYAVVQFKYTIADVVGDSHNYYSVEEDYTLSYADGEITMLNFDRYVDEIFDRADVDAKNNLYEIGVVSSGKVKYKSSDKSRKVAFVRNQQLWYYNYRENQITHVFGFWLDDVENNRNTYDNHDINIIFLDDDGNMYFSVYGYMNRGKHEGKLGVALYKYMAAEQELSELIFVETNVPYSSMKLQTSRLTYFNGQRFYYMLGDQVNCIDVNDKKASTYVSGISMDKVYVSDDMSVIAYCGSDNQVDNDMINVARLDTETTVTENAGSGECLIGYGFKDTDFIYGTCDASDSSYTVKVSSFDSAALDYAARKSIPSKSITIVDRDGKQLKDYNKGYYIANVLIETDLIYLIRAQKIGSEFVQYDDDFITYKNDELKQFVSTVLKTSTEGIDKMYFTPPANIYLSYVPKLLITKNKKNDDGIYMNTQFENKSLYTVFTGSGVSGEFDVAGDAINYAIDNSGIVVENDGSIIYRQSDAKEYNTIASAIFHYSSGSVAASLQDCLYMVLNYQGVDITYDELADYTDPVEALTSLGKSSGVDITGLSLKLLVGYVSDGIPVISRIDDGRYVLVVSYNEESIRYYDPVINDEVKVSRKAYESKMSLGNNILYTYVQY